MRLLIPYLGTEKHTHVIMTSAKSTRHHDSLDLYKTRYSEDKWFKCSKLHPKPKKNTLYKPSLIILIRLRGEFKH